MKTFEGMSEMNFQRKSGADLEHRRMSISEIFPFLLEGYQILVKYHQKMVSYISAGINSHDMRAEKKIFETFYELKERRLYYNQIKEYSKLSHSSLQNALQKLLKQGVISEEKTKSNKFYILKDIKFVALKYSEIALQRFHNLSRGVRIPLQNFLENPPQDIFTVVLFGSSSRNEEKKGSDIDLLVVSNKKIDLKLREKKANVTSNYPLSSFQCTVRQFIENKDHVIIQARKTGFPIYKEQNFFEVELL